MEIECVTFVYILVKYDSSVIRKNMFKNKAQQNLMLHAARRKESQKEKDLKSLKLIL